MTRLRRLTVREPLKYGAQTTANTVCMSHCFYFKASRKVSLLNLGICAANRGSVYHSIGSSRFPATRLRSVTTREPLDCGDQAIVNIIKVSVYQRVTATHVIQ
jgi:hypothetical protein